MLMTHIKSAIKFFNKFGWFFDKERNPMNNKILKEIDEMNTVNSIRWGGSSNFYVDDLISEVVA